MPKRFSAAASRVHCDSLSVPAGRFVSGHTFRRAGGGRRGIRLQPLWVSPLRGSPSVPFGYPGLPSWALLCRACGAGL